MIESSDKAFFRFDDDLIVGNDTARGPWSADACHAGPVTGILARAVESIVKDKQLLRMTVMFQRPIPIDGFRVSGQLERNGRSSATAIATLETSDGRTCATAWSLHLATIDGAELPTATIPGPVFADASPGRFPVGRPRHDLPFFGNGVEVAYPPSETSDPGATTLWMRTLPLVEDETPSPFQSVCPLADCGNGISRNSTFDEVTFVNPDLTINLFRLPKSEWLASSAISFWEPTGAGLSQAQLFDTGGAIGFALQTLLVQPIQ